MHASIILLTIATILPSALSLPDIFIGTRDTCSPGRYPTEYVASLVRDDACANGDASALVGIGNYPISNAGCGLGAFTIGGFTNITFEGCTGPGGPYPTTVLRNGVKKLDCAPVKKTRADRQCNSDLCAQQGRTGTLKTLYRCK